MTTHIMVDIESICKRPGGVVLAAANAALAILARAHTNQGVAA